MNNVCRDCMLDKHLNRYPEGTPEATVKEYQEAVKKIVDQDRGPAGRRTDGTGGVLRDQSREKAAVWRRRNGLYTDQTPL